MTWSALLPNRFTRLEVMHIVAFVACPNTQRRGGKVPSPRIEEGERDASCVLYVSRRALKSTVSCEVRINGLSPEAKTTSLLSELSFPRATVEKNASISNQWSNKEVYVRFGTLKKE